MKLDDLVPVLVMVVYVALIVLKRRKSKAAGADKRVAARSGSGPPPQSPGLFSKFGERLKAFFAELEQQFRIEAEKARIKNLEPAQRQSILDSQEPASDRPVVESPESPKVVPRGKERKTGQRTVEKKQKHCALGTDICRSRQKIRNAIVWSEILAPPLGIRQEKRPWED